MTTLKKFCASKQFFNHFSGNHEFMTFYEIKFGFQSAYSTEHAISQLSNGISNSFNENKFTLGVFIDFSEPLTRWTIKY